MPTRPSRQARVLMESLRESDSFQPFDLPKERVSAQPRHASRRLGRAIAAVCFATP